MHYLVKVRAAAITTLLLGTAYSVCAAQDQSPAPAPPNSAAPVPTPPDASDPPSVAGRIALIEGAVSFRPAQGDTWALAELNRAITTGDRFWVDSVGRAEIQFGSNALRMSAETEVDLLHLDDDALQTRVPQGTVELRIRSFGAGGIYEIDAPNAAVALGEAGAYRVDVSPDGQTTTITVRDGQARVTAAGSTFDVDANKVATVKGDSAPTYDIADAGPPDAFEQWVASRDQRQDHRGASAQYVSADMGGTEDLDDYGSWTTEADYGPVWYPPADIAVGWAPYRFGHWAWEGVWGWVWVEDEPWGWAPFHYGRWAFIGRRWGWCPGPSIYRPVFGPALVAFVGGPQWGVALGIGAEPIGWFPLAPREPYFPPYHTGLAYRERINVTNITNVTEITNVNATNINYRNRNIDGAVTAVPRTIFQRGEPVGRSAIRVPADAALKAPVLGTGPRIAPTSESVAPLRGVAGRTPLVPPRDVATRPVIAIHAPPPAPVPLSLQRNAIQANGGRPLTVQQLGSIRAGAPQLARPSPVRSAVVAHGTLAPARSALPPTKPALPSQGFSGRPLGAPAGHAVTPLDQEYQTERAQMESRHVQEFATPPAREAPLELQQRQEGEHQELMQRYQAAQAHATPHLPPPAPRPPSPPPSPRVQGGGRPRE